MKNLKYNNSAEEKVFFINPILYSSNILFYKIDIIQNNIKTKANQKCKRPPQNFYQYSV